MFYLAKQCLPHCTGYLILCLLWNRKVYYHIHKSGIQVRVLNQITPVYFVAPKFFKNYLNVILNVSLLIVPHRTTFYFSGGMFKELNKP